MQVSLSGTYIEMSCLRVLNVERKDLKAMTRASRVRLPIGGRNTAFRFERGQEEI